MNQNIAKLIAPCYDNVFFDIIHSQHTHYMLGGGRGSTKSSFVSLVIVILVLLNPDVHVVIMRKVGSTLKHSVYNQMLWALEALGVISLFKITMSPMEITYKATGQKILFFGVDDKVKLKSLKPSKGYVGVVWFEEFDQFAGMEEIRNVLQSLIRGGEKSWCFYSFNPPRSKDAWVNSEVMVEEKDRIYVHNTYLDVPSEWLGHLFIHEAEKLKARNLDAYRHEYLGEAVGTGGDVFSNVEHMDMSDAFIDSLEYKYFGLDFGFAIDPLAFVCMAYSRKHEILYIYDEIYQQKLTNRKASKLILPKVNNELVWADSAEPKSIRELKEWGLYIIGVKKGPDSVEYGIKWLQNLEKIYIDKNRCPNTFREFVTYEYEQNKDGQFISSYPDKNNHTIDAARYGCSGIMRSEKDVTSRNVNLW